MAITTSKALPDGFHKVKLFPQQANFALVDDVKFKLFSAGIASGKSSCGGALWLIRRAFQNPETLYVLGANSYKQLNQATYQAFTKRLKEFGIRWVTGKRPPESWGVTRDFPDHNGVMTLENGCQILLWSFERYELIEGIEIGGFWIDETRKTKKGAWLYLVERMRCPLSTHLHGRVTTTPGGRNHWVWKEFNPDDEAAKRFYAIVYMATTENTTLNREFLDHLLASIDPVLLAQELGGRYIDLQQGKVYRCWDSKRNGRLVYPYNPNRPLIWSLDFNILSNSPLSTVIGQEHYNAELGIWQLQVIDEIVIPRGDTEQACHEFLKRYSHHPHQVKIYGDASGDFSSVSEYKIIRQVLGPVFANRLARATNKRSNPLVYERTAAVNAALINGLGQVRLFIDPKKCPILINDLAEVEPKSSSTGKPGIDKSDPLLTHSSDALGYWVIRRLPSVVSQKITPIKGNLAR